MVISLCPDGSIGQEILKGDESGYRNCRRLFTLYAHAHPDPHALREQCMSPRRFYMVVWMLNRRVACCSQPMEKIAEILRNQIGCNSFVDKESLRWRREDLVTKEV